MREIQVHTPARGRPVEVVRRLEFRAGGAELVAWCGPDELTLNGRVGETRALHVHTLATGENRELEVGEPFADWDMYDWRTSDPVLSPDGAFLAYEASVHEDDSFLLFERVDVPGPDREQYPPLSTWPHNLGGMAFTPDGKALVAVQHFAAEGANAREVIRFEMKAISGAPKRFRTAQNPFTGAPIQVPARNLKWKPVLTLHDPERLATAALSVDGTLLAVGGVEGGLYVADLKRKQLFASFSWQGRALRDRRAVRVAFDAAGEWVAMLANGRLFARPLGEGRAWQTKDTLGYAHDFAFHPGGRVLCAVFADGQARYLDAHTGAVRQSFKWAKKPGPLYAVAFAPDGLTCAAGGANGKVIIWDVDA